MIEKIKIKIVLFLLILSTLISYAEEPILFVGAYGDLNLNLHFTDFSKLPGVPNCCPSFKNGKGFGFAVGALLELPIVNSFSFETRIGFSTLNAKLKENEYIANYPVRNPQDPNTFYTAVNVDYVIDSKIYNIGIEPTFNFNFFSHLTSTIGLRLAYLFTSRFDQYEQLISPDNVVFIDNNSRERLKITDEIIPDKKEIQLFGVIGFGFQLPLGQNFFIAPEIRYYLPFFDLSSVTWKASSLQFGTSLKVPIYKARERFYLRDTIYQRDTIIKPQVGLSNSITKFIEASKKIDTFVGTDTTIELITYIEKYETLIPKESLLKCSITVTGISKDGKRQENPTMIIEETEVEEQFPLLPQVFFKYNSAELSQSGMSLLKQDETSSFDENKLKWGTLDIYSHLLNIIGHRLKRNFKADLTIVGCNNNQGLEQGNIKLSQDRANAVKEYLVNIWKIEPQRLNIKKQNLPDIPSNIQVPDGIVENQRAELRSNDLNVLKPIVLKEILRTSNPPVVEITPLVEAEVGIDSWSLTIEQQGKLLRTYSGQDLQGKISWQVEDEPIPLLETPINIQFTTIDKTGKKCVENKTLSIQQLTIKKKRFELKDDKRIERFSLILFDFDKANITQLHSKVLDDIKQRIQPNSKVTIIGYADRTGGSQYNKDLALRRCQEVQKVLKVKEENLQLVPIGSDSLLYNNDIPEGRSYSRTVQIIIETPIK